MKEGNVVLLIPEGLDQQLDFGRLQARAGELAPRLGYSLQPLIEALRPAS